MKILLAQPRGFCAGVVRAIDIVDKALELYGAPVYVLHEIVHNQKVLADLTAKGAVFVETLEEIPIGAHAIFSAHGVSKVIVGKAEQRELVILDASCPLVTKVHLQSLQYEKEGYEVIVIGHQGHPEVDGICGNLENFHVVDCVADIEALPDTTNKRFAYVTQTTLSVDDTRELLDALTLKIPNITGPDIKDICYATQNRQNAVKSIADHVELMLIIGADNSSNSNRLKEVASAKDVTAYRIQSASELQTAWFDGVNTVGISAGASTPEELVSEVVTELQRNFSAEVSLHPGVEETIQFRLPRQLQG
ncbi:MAG: 4-hydroxy-3-methylbut-2-enyl diphosphate reductase [Immundisolibacteraceae bacterium]|nr:4-hydroxy-3-methylbut-2-enyl diphosphate reductase [Immundisolibacteraceae bacterium]